jgi:hypothetical protein
VSSLRIAATTMTMPIVFVVGWILCQWVWWIFGDFYDAVSPIVGPPSYDPGNVGFLQQSFRDLVPAGAAMVGAAWVALKIVRGVPLGYRLGAGIILVGLAGAAVFVTWSVIRGNSGMTWRDLILQWATVGVVALVARSAERDI